MNKSIFILLLSLIIPFLSFSQTQQELLEIGIKPKLVEKITEKHNGSVTDFYESWSKKGRVHKSLVSSLEQLGYKREYLVPLWKKSQRIRLVKIVSVVSLGVVGIGEGFYSEGIRECGCSPNPNFY